jgi:hypothetical protein
MNVVLGKAGLTNLYMQHVRSDLDWQDIGEYGVAVQRRIFHISRARARTRRGGRQCTYGTNLRGDKKASGRHDPGLLTLLWQREHSDAWFKAALVQRRIKAQFSSVASIRLYRKR